MATKVAQTRRLRVIVGGVTLRASRRTLEQTLEGRGRDALAWALGHIESDPDGIVGIAGEYDDGAGRRLAIQVDIGD